jgi:hypothetical protein
MPFLAALPAILAGAGHLFSAVGARKQEKKQYNAQKAEFDRSERSRIAILRGILQGLGIDVADPRIISSFLTPRQYTGARPTSGLSTLGSTLTGLAKFLPVDRETKTSPPVSFGSRLKVGGYEFSGL